MQQERVRIGCYSLFQNAALAQAVKELKAYRLKILPKLLGAYRYDLTSPSAIYPSFS